MRSFFRSASEVNRSGKFYLSHTRLADRFTLRLALGNPRATLAHVEGCWDQLRRAAAVVRSSGQAAR